MWEETKTDGQDKEVRKTRANSNGGAGEEQTAEACQDWEKQKSKTKPRVSE